MNITPSIQPASMPASITALSNHLESQTGKSFQDALKTHEATDIPAVDAAATIEAATEKWEKEQERLKKVGQDFEALFFSMMLKEMRNSISSEEGGGMFAGEGSDTYGGMFDTFIGEHMATSGQLGLAEIVTKSVVAQYEQKTNPEAADTNTTDETKEVK
jgi:Rod binding domain-containing protein